MSLLLGILLTGTLHMAWGHGYLQEPPMRGYMRVVFSQCTNYNRDFNMMGLNCGGMSVQYNAINMGRCAACGEEFSIPLGLRKNEYGGIYAPGDVGRVYVKGSIITVQIMVTAAHKGWYEIRLCDKAETKQGDLDICFSDPNNYYTLPFVDNNYETRYPVNGSKLYTNYVKLPDGVTCDRCIMQWWYRTNNNWNTDVQEHFVNCADIAIVEPSTMSNDIRYLATCPYNPLDVQPFSSNGQVVVNPNLNTNQSTGQQGQNPPVGVTAMPTRAPTTYIPPGTTSGNSSTLDILCAVCDIANMQSYKICQCCQKTWKSVLGTSALNTWCTNNCNHNPPFCPDFICITVPVYALSCK